MSRFVAARPLADDQWNNRAFNLTGPESIDHAQVASAISAASGRTVTFQDAAPADLKQGLLNAGLTEAYADFLLLIFGYLKAGYNAAVHRRRKNHPRPRADRYPELCTGLPQRLGVNAQSPAGKDQIGPVYSPRAG